jgi:hypothetical protein
VIRRGDSRPCSGRIRSRAFRASKTPTAADCRVTKPTWPRTLRALYYQPSATATALESERDTATGLIGDHFHRLSRYSDISSNCAPGIDALSRAACLRAGTPAACDRACRQVTRDSTSEIRSGGTVHRVTARPYCGRVSRTAALDARRCTPALHRNGLDDTAAVRTLGID